VGGVAMKRKQETVKVEFSGAHAEILKYLARVAFVGGCAEDRHLTAGRYAFEMIERELLRISLFSFGVPFGVLASRIAKGERIDFDALMRAKRAERMPLTREDCDARRTAVEHSGHRVKPKPSMADVENELEGREAIQ
jgi:hypothetical protein